MSEHCVTVVRIDVLSPAQAEQVAAGIERWLGQAGVVGGPDDGEPPVLAVAGGRSFRPGPSLAARTLAPHLPARGVVDVTARRALHHAYGNSKPARCGACGTVLEHDADSGALGTWWEDGEPVLTCATCGRAAPYGDWPCDWPSVVGAPAVSFHLDSDPAQELLDQVAAWLGGRTRVVRTHL